MVDRHKAASTAGTGTGQRAAIACRSCRQRKVKCDAQSDPSENGCGPCRRAGKECMLDPMSDGRRSVNRKCVDRLQQRIEMLEARSQIVGDRAGWESSEDSLRHHLHPHLQQYHPPPAEYTPMLLPCGPRSTQSTNTTDTIPQPPPPPAPPVPPQPQPQLPLAPLPTPPPNPPAVSICIEQAAPSPVSGSSPGAASSNSHGSPSFYGATSHPHVVSASEEAAQMQLFDEADAGGIGIDLDPASPHLRAHLFQSFFKYQTLWVDVVDKDAFLSQPQSQSQFQSQSRWRSSFLENAMLACGTRLSTSKSVRALGPKYCEWAKDDVLRAMSDPTPANLQGFLLLSEYEVTQGNDRPAWMYCGVACRMLSDLGLHELASIGDGPGSAQEAAVAAATARESDLAYALLSACVVYEGVWTLYLGRPSSIPRAVMRTAAARCRQRRHSDTPWLNAWVGLCVPMAEITRLLNEKAAGGDEDDNNNNNGHEREHRIGHGDTNGDGDVDRLSALRTVAGQVDDWYENLPPELAYHEDRLINMHLAGYGLHAQYCKIQILLQQALAQLPQRPPTRPRSRPLMSSNPRKRPHSQMADRGASVDRAVERAERAERAGSVPDEPSGLVAYQYALRIARLVVTYREAFGMEQIPSIMLDNAVVAATAMIRHHNSSIGTGTGTSDTIWLRQLLKSMESVQPHFPIIARMLDSLKQICGSGPLINMILPARRGSAEATLDFGALDHHNGSIDSANNSNNNDNNNSSSSSSNQDNSMALGGGPDMLWDCFDAAITPSIFQSSAFSDSVLGLPPPSEALGSVLSQAVS